MENIEFMNFGNPENLVPNLSTMKATGMPPEKYTTGWMEVGSVPVEENGQIIHYGRDGYRWDNETNKWVLTTVYDEMNHKWIDVNH